VVVKAVDPRWAVAHRESEALSGAPLRSGGVGGQPRPASKILTPPTEDFFTAEMVAEKLHQTVQWVESKCRRRSSYPIPFHNIGNHRLFLMSEVRAWVMNAPQVIHSRHRRRTKQEIAAVQRAKQ